MVTGYGLQVTGYSECVFLGLAKCFAILGQAKCFAIVYTPKQSVTPLLLKLY